VGQFAIAAQNLPQPALFHGEGQPHLLLLGQP
jgi:hypothetical protein